MLVDNFSKLSGPKAGHGLEVQKQGADLLLGLQEPNTVEADFSKLLAQELPEEERRKTVDPAVPLPTADAAPAPVQVHPNALQGAQYFRTLVASGAASDASRLAQTSEKGGLQALTLAVAQQQSPLSEPTQDRLAPLRLGAKPDAGDKQRQAAEFDAVKPPTSWLQEDAQHINALPLAVLTSGERLPQVVVEGQGVKPVAYSFQSAEVTRDLSMTGGSVGMPDAPLVADASQATEKASYWAANGTQNLALTLEGQGEEAVSIKISLTGQETHVDIRTDHVALRQMIEGTVQVMKDQLSGEGISLSGVSVGSGHQGQSMEQGRNGQSRMAPREFDYKNMALNKGPAPLVHSVLPIAGRKLSIFV
jgi:hypothetical protein